MIETKLNVVVNSVESMRALLELKLKGRTSYNVAKILKQLDEELKLFDEARVRLVKQYCEKDENGEPALDENNNYKILDENMQEFNEEVQKLLDTPITIDRDKIPLSELESNDIQPKIMLDIEDFIAEEE